MKDTHSIILAGVMALSLSACSTTRNRTKSLATMAGAAVIGGTIGAMVAPKNENGMAHTALWGGVSAASAGAISLFVFDEEAKREAAEVRASKLEKELGEFRASIEPQLVASNEVQATKSLPPQLQHLVTPAKWSLYRVDRWTTVGDNELVHQDQLFRFEQSQLNPQAPKPKGE